MNNILQDIGNWLGGFALFFVTVFPRWFGAWLICLLFLVYTFRALKPRLRSRVLAFDAALNTWARRLRYKLQQADAVLEPNTPPSERVLLTWFFRFWTNFASAPSLGFLSFAIPFWFFQHKFYRVGIAGSDDVFWDQSYWLLPTFCYFGSMGLSYVVKRVFKRLRPVRDKGAFGHSLKDGSFPSGHSLTAFCFWMPMIVTVFRHTQSLATTVFFAVIAVLVVALTGLSRIYMAVHWPSDVAGGFIIGAIWTVVFLITLSGLF